MENTPSMPAESEDLAAFLAQHEELILQIVTHCHDRKMPRMLHNVREMFAQMREDSRAVSASGTDEDL